MQLYLLLIEEDYKMIKLSLNYRDPTRIQRQCTDRAYYSNCNLVTIMGFYFVKKGKCISFYCTTLVLNVVAKAHSAMKWINVGCVSGGWRDVRGRLIWGALNPKSDASSFQLSVDMSCLFLLTKSELPNHAMVHSRPCLL